MFNARVRENYESQIKLHEESLKGTLVDVYRLQKVLTGNGAISGIYPELLDLSGDDNPDEITRDMAKSAIARCKNYPSDKGGLDSSMPINVAQDIWRILKDIALQIRFNRP